jgi:uncharacterized protein YjbI with pentapeptide repeats
MKSNKTHTLHVPLVSVKNFWLRQSHMGLVTAITSNLGSGVEAETRAAQIAGVLQSRGLPVNTANLQHAVSLLQLPNQLRELSAAAQTPNSDLNAKLSAVRDLASSVALANWRPRGTGQGPSTAATTRPPFSEMQRIADHFDKTPVRPPRPAAGQPITDISAFINDRANEAPKLDLVGQDLRNVPKLGSQLRALRKAQPNLIIDMSNANLSNVALPGTNLRGARLNGANLSAADLRAVDLHAALLTGADLRGANLSNSRLTANFDRADLSGARLDNANLTNAGLQRANLSGSSMVEAQLSKADLQDANLQNANLLGCNMNKAYMRGADLRGANLSLASLFQADLSAARLEGAKLQKANLTQIKLEGANLEGADLRQANLTRADLTDATLTNAQVRGAITKGIILNGSNQSGVDWKDTLR